MNELIKQLFGQCWQVVIASLARSQSKDGLFKQAGLAEENRRYNQDFLPKNVS